MKEKREMWVPLEKKSQMERGTNRMTERRKKILNFFSLFISFSDLQKSDRRNSSGQEQEVLYLTRATRGYQKHGISPDFHVK